MGMTKDIILVSNGTHPVTTYEMSLPNPATEAERYDARCAIGGFYRYLCKRTVIVYFLDEDITEKDNTFWFPMEGNDDLIPAMVL